MEGRSEEESTGNGRRRREEGPKEQSPGTHGQFMGDEFRTYMSRKIELQRKQFGLVLPPAPVVDAVGGSRLDFSANDLQVGDGGVEGDLVPSPGTKRTAKDDGDPSLSASVPSGGNVGHRSGSKRRRKEEGLSAVLNRLKKRHGSGSSRKPSRKRRRHTTEIGESSSTTDSSESSLPADSRVSESGACDSLREKMHNNDDVHGDSREPSESSNACPEASQANTSSIVAPATGTQLNRRHRPDLFFLGVVVLVNGFTTPDASTLMRMLQKHGGDLEKYETSRVTHIIASALSTAKALIYKRQRRPTPVVRPEWVVDSCREGKVLPHADYLLEEVRDENAGSKTVKSFFSPRQPDNAEKMHGPKKELSVVSKPAAKAAQAPDGAALTDGSTPEANSDKDVALTETKNGMHTCSSTLPLPSDRGNNLSSPKRKTAPEVISPAAVKLSDKPSRGHQVLASSCTEAQTREKATSHEGTCMTKEANSPTSKNANTSGLVRTVGTDPNFLHSYFSNSRLSFIGSFKQRVNATETNSPTSHRRRSRRNAQRFVFHVDIDCFFAAVALRKYPQYRYKPVAVGHGWKTDSKGQPVPVGDGASVSSVRGVSKKSYSELSTCNYVARKFGIRKGMFLHQAKELCPDLIVLPYDYEGYEEVTAKVTEILYHRAEEFEGAVEQVSCDEAYLEIFLEVDEKEQEMPFDLAKSLAEKIRSDILTSTECTASIGIASNKFLAKLATDKVKPDGSFVVKDFHALLENLKLRDLPGIGWKLERKLQSHRLESVSDVVALGDEAESELCSILGAGNGKKILGYIEGKDDRPVQAAPRKTIGAECNYGVRFDGPYGPDYLLEGLAKEVGERMKAVDVSGKRITLKILQRKEGASNPAKFLGHGSCNSLSKSCELPVTAPTRDWVVLFRTGMKLFDEMAVNKVDIRGMGIVISNLNNTGTPDSSAMKMSTWLKSNLKESNIPNEDSREETFDGEVSNQQLSQSGDDQRGFIRSQSKASAERRTVRFSTDIQCRERSHFALEAEHSQADEGEDYVVPTLSQIDEDVLLLLPEDIQSNVRRKLQLDSHADEKEEEDDDACIRNVEEDESNLTALEDQGLVVVEDSNEGVALSTGGAANDASDSCKDLEEGIMLPPLSQIDTDEVLALPVPMRNAVLKQIRAKEESIGKSNKRCSLSPPDKSRKRQHTIARQQKRRDSDCDGHFRQMSVKRMLKLASVKSGNDHLEEGLGGESISLTQLESLPLEMQLQVANNDEAPVGTTSHRASRSRSSSQKNTSPPRPSDERRFSHCNSPPRGPTEALNGGGESLCFESSQSSHAMSPQREVLQASEKIYFEPMQDFYSSNVLPLNQWMDGIPDPSMEDVERAKDFFFICVSEKRLDDVVKMLRVIKRRSDEWGKDLFKILLEAVDERLIAAEGRRLDRRSLGLTYM